MLNLILMDSNLIISKFSDKNRWVVSPFWTGFSLVIFFGFLAHFVFPYFFPHLFREGIVKLLADPFYFHDLAVKLADSPWSEFTLRPSKQLPAGVLGFIYKVSGIYKPFMMLPVLGVLAGLTIRSIIACLDVLGVSGRWWPLIIGILFTVTPTSISWMVYPHKDAFIVPGVILIGWAFMTTIVRGFGWKNCVAILAGSLLVLLTKNYFAELLSLGTFLVLIITIFQKNHDNQKKNRILFILSSLIIFGFISYFWRGYSNAGGKDYYSYSSSSSGFETGEPKPRYVTTKENWVSVPGGDLINKPLQALAYTRERFLHEIPYGRTNYLPEVHLAGGYDTLMFLPRSLQLALLEPLPWRNYDQPTSNKFIFTLAQFEMILVYISILLLLSSGFRSLSPQVFVCIALAIPFLLAFGYAMPNIGSINRYRFPFLILIKLAGLAALWNADRSKWPGRLLMWVDPPKLNRLKKKILFLVPDDITFLIQRLVMAQGAQKAGYDVVVASEDTGVSDKIRDLGFTFHRLDLNRGGLNPFADFKPFMRLVLFLAKERPDILQCVSIKPVLYGATAGTIVGLKRIVCLVNGLGYAFEAKGIKGKVVFTVAKAFYRNALALPGIRVIFQNPDDRGYFIDHKLVDVHKTILIRGSGVNMEKFKPTPQPQNSKPIILFVGRLLWSKGIQELIDAAKILKNENIAFSLKIVGQPDERNPEAVPVEYLKELEKEGVIEWLGRQKDMPAFYREADIVVLPSISREGLPLTMLEAASTGRALVVTDVPGCREVVEDQVNGFLVPSKNVLELTNALKKLLLDPELRRTFGEAGSLKVKNEFSAEIVQMKLNTVYDSLLTNTQSRNLIPVTTKS